GTSSISRSAFSPVSYDTAITTASQPLAWRAASTTAACSAIACSARVATIAAPKSAVTGTISVPGEATRRASAAAVSVTKAVVLAFRTRMRMMLLLAWLRKKLNLDRTVRKMPQQQLADAVGHLIGGKMPD